METLKQLHERALAEHWAVPHFNFSALAQLGGILDAVRETSAPVVLGLSEGERDAVGLRQAVAIVRSLREEGMTVFLNADHSHSVERAKAAVDAGFDSIHVDLSKEPYEKNVAATKEVVEYAKSKNPDISVEGELGYLATDSSTVYKSVVEIPADSYTNPQQASEYVSATGVDRFAPAVGNLHGIAANEPQVHFELIEQLRKAVPNSVALVMHGGSGIPDDDFTRAIAMGFNNVHVSTELRVAYTKALRKTLAEKPDEVTPYHYTKEARAATAALTKEKLQLFGAAGKVAGGSSL